MKIKSIRKVKKIAGKKVLLRVDFNIPMENGHIQDDYKIVASLPTIRFLLRYKSKIIIATHLGRPDGEKIKKYSLKPGAKRLRELLGEKNHPVSRVKFINDCIGFKVGNEVSKLKEGEILMLENLRFYKEEQKDNKEFAKQLANLADIYINDAFANSHRKHASMNAIQKYLPAYAGLLLEEEIKNLYKIIHPKKPLIVVIGGAKIKTKIRLLKKISKKGAKILIGGALANNFLKAHNLEIGQSLIDKASLSFAKKFKKKNILLPIDVLVRQAKEAKGKPEVKSVDKVGKEDIILDIGPETIRLFSNHIKKAKTIIWNGPMGKFEEEHFKHGSLAIARVVAARARGWAFGVVGGGDTIKILKMTKMQDYVDWISTGGGAMITYLSGEPMPGLKQIVK